MQRAIQKSFHEILKDHLGAEPEVIENKASPLKVSSYDQSIFNSWETLQNFAIKNIKTNFANTTYRVHVVNKEEKRAEALLLKYQTLYSKLASKEVQDAFKFLFERGGVSFLDLSVNSLKKDFRMLAKKLHPDISRESTSANQKAEEFRILKKSYDILNHYLHSRNG